MLAVRRTSAADVFPTTAPRPGDDPSELLATLVTQLLSLRRTLRARTTTWAALVAHNVERSAAGLLRSTRGVGTAPRAALERARTTGAARAAAARAVLVDDAVARLVGVAGPGLARARAASQRRFDGLRSSLVPAFGPQATAAAALLVVTSVLAVAGIAAASVVPAVVTRPGELARSAAPPSPLDAAEPVSGKVPTPEKATPPAAPVDPAAVPGVETAAVASPVEVTLEPVLPTERGALPLGMGMWLWLPDRVEGGNVDALVARSQAIGLSHLYVRTGSSRSGFYAGPYLDELLPKAHAAGIRVFGWDFPYLEDVGGDIGRAVAAINHTTPTGHRINGFAADIETPSEGTNLTVEGVASYGAGLRAAVGDAYPLIAVVPRPSPLMLTRFPYTEATAAFSAIAPMSYWLNRQPDTDVINDVTILAPLGKPVIPIGQAYDGAAEGGRPGPPPPDEIVRFLAAAEGNGAVGASFWSWQHASQAIFDTIAAAPEFRWQAGTPDQLRPGQVRALQAQLSALGHPVAASGAWDEATTDALIAYQQRARLAATGVLDEATLAFLLSPFAPPVVPTG